MASINILKTKRMKKFESTLRGLVFVVVALMAITLIVEIRFVIHEREHAMFVEKVMEKEKAQDKLMVKVLQCLNEVMYEQKKKE